MFTGLHKSAFALLLFVAVGCGKKEEIAAPSSPPAAPPPPPAPITAVTPGDVPPPPPPVPGATVPQPTVTEENPDPNADANTAMLAALTRAYRAYSDPSARPNAGDLTPEATQTFPPLKDLSELVRAGFLKAVPAPPPGKKFSIDHVNHEIKLVNQ